MKDDKEFLEAFTSRKVPDIRIGYQKWHRLFALSGKTSEIKQAGRKVKSVVRTAGKA